jgi:hypothetical protein
MTKRYSYYWGISALAVGIITLSTTLIIDPYGLYTIINIDGINQQKEGVRSKIRFVKTLELPLRQPKTILLGTSRVHDGINPAHSALQEKAPVYNLAVDMNRIHETLALLNHAIENSKIERVILGLDLFMFNSLQRQNHDFDQTLTGRKIGYSDYLAPTLLSRTALYDSYRTLKVSIAQPERVEFLRNGYRPQAFYGLKNFQGSHYYTNWIFLTPKDQGTKYYNHLAVDDEVFLEFEKIIIICKKNNIDMRLYINPAHAHLDGEGLIALGKWHLLEEWKRRIVSISSLYNVPVWDFSGYNSVTTEKIQSPMDYYWDSSHFTEKVGNWIIDIIFNKPSSAPSDFGFLVTPNNIEAHLSSIRTARENYASKGRTVIERLQMEYKAIIDGAPLDQLRLIGMY